MLNSIFTKIEPNVLIAQMQLDMIITHRNVYVNAQIHAHATINIKSGMDIQLVVVDVLNLCYVQLANILTRKPASVNVCPGVAQDSKNGMQSIVDASTLTAQLIHPLLIGQLYENQ